LIIIGGGPAGLTAAIYAIRKRLNVLVLSKDLGGKTNYRLALPWVEDYQVIKGWRSSTSSATSWNTWILPATSRRLRRLKRRMIALS